MRGSQGMTLIELVTSLGVIAIITTFAAPSFNAFVRDSGRASTVNAVVLGLTLARSEAIRTGHVVSVCKSPDGSTCVASAQWHDGWIVFENLDRDEPAVRDPDERILHVDAGWRSGTITSNRVSFSYRAYTQGVVNGSIVFCDRRGSEHARAIIVSHTGRARVSRRDASNKALPCPAT